MKKTPAKLTLTLKRETLRVLTNTSLKHAAGGGGDPDLTEIVGTCTTKMYDNKPPVR